MVLEHGNDHASQWEAIGLMAPKIGCTTETLRGGNRQPERDQGLRPGATSVDQERIKSLEQEVRELRQANKILIFVRSGIFHSVDKQGADIIFFSRERRV